MKERKKGEVFEKWSPQYGMCLVVKIENSHSLHHETVKILKKNIENDKRYSS